MTRINALPGISWLDQLPPWDGKNFSPLEVPRQILSYLSNPQDRYKTIHIAGTNGKGSVAHGLSAILECEYPDEKIGLMTSPHLFTLEERGKINSRNGDSSILSDCLLETKKASEAIGITPTYFVAITCALFLLFEREKVAYAVIEAGLGGRYDATNVLKKPELCIITTIGMDHEEQLGNTLKEIAWNKGGIIKKDVTLLYGSLKAEAENELIALCNLEQTAYQSIQRDSFSWHLKNVEPTGILEESYQVHNLTLTAQAASFLGCSDTNISKGLSNLKITGRLDLIRGKAEGESDILLDCAHNPEGIKALLQYTAQLSKKKSYNHVSFLFSFLARKNWRESLSVLRTSLSTFPLPYAIQWTSFSNESVSPEVLQEVFQEGEIVENVSIAIKDHRKRKTGSILVCAGSTRLIEAAYLCVESDSNTYFQS